MIFKLKINKETLHTTTNDSDMIINYVKLVDGVIELEISKPDPELPTLSYGNYNINS